MRLFFIEWSGKEFGLTDVVKEIRKQSHDIVYWSGPKLESNVNKNEFPDTIFHDYHDARAGIGSPDVDDSGFPPPSENLIKQMYETESTLLVMMNKRYEWMSENQKKHLYYRYLKYWDGVIKKYKPDAIVCPSAPHTIYDLVIYGLAKMYGIKTIIFELTAVYDRSIVMDDYREGSSDLIKQLEADHEKSYSVSDFDSDVRKYYENQMNPEESSTPQIVKQFMSEYSIIKTVKIKSKVFKKSIHDGTFFEKLFNRVLRWKKGNLKKEYQALQVEPDFSKKYIYVTLHYQPECTTSPLGGIFVDQLLMIEMLSYCLPKDWIIYVKEHPFQWKPRGLIYFSYRYEGFYRDIAKLKNVYLVPVSTDTFTLSEKAIAVASVGGTSPWEGVLRGKPGIIFGYPWYRGCHGIFQANNIESCSKAISEIEKGFRVDHQKIINFLGSFQSVVLNAFRDPYNKGLSCIDVTQNIKNHVAIISRKLSE